MSRPTLTVINGSSRSPSRLDWATVEQALGSSGKTDEPRTLKFQRLVLSKLFKISLLEADQQITDGGDDCGIDCFVIDYKMPNMDGIDLANRLRNHDIATPIILITGYSDDNISAKAAIAGVHHVLLKPHLEESLFAHIWSAIQEGQPCR